MADAIESKTDLTKSIEAELIKTHIEYDVNNRAEYIYTAPAHAVDGAPCIVTKYTYDGVSTRVVTFQEFRTVWDSAWDLTLP
jgi:hypothetical protein